MTSGHRSRHTPCAVERNSFRSSPTTAEAANGMNSVLRRVALACGVVGLAVACFAAPPGDAPPPAAPAKNTPPPPASVKTAEKGGEQTAPRPAPKHITESVRGKVVWLNEAVARKYGVRLDADAAESVAALETADGELIPIMKEDRGRGFWKDARLRGIDLELLVRRYKGLPMVQVIRVYRLKEGKKLELDYWCDVCAIQMFELKQCECCQGPTRLRERPVEDKK